MIAHAVFVEDDGARAIEPDEGRRPKVRERQCAVTRATLPASEMMRFVVGPGDVVVPDIKGKLPGRGIWVTATWKTLGEAVKRNVFARSFKRSVRVPADLVTRTEQLLEQSVLDALAIAGKAGLVAAGFTKAENALAQQEIIALLHAAGASPDGSRKLDAAWRRSHRSEAPFVIGFLTSAQLDLALNRPNVVHAALLAGSVSETLLARCQRLERFRTGDQLHQAGEAVPN